jgi:hypothetical protein
MPPQHKAGGCHCHRGGLAGQSFGSKGEAQKALSSGAVTTPPPTKAQPYNRKLYPHWIDADGDCQDTRQDHPSLDASAYSLGLDGACAWKKFLGSSCRPERRQEPRGP